MKVLILGDSYFAGQIGTRIGSGGANMWVALDLLPNHPMQFGPREVAPPWQNN
jgi:hypothetical protein